MSNQKCVKSEDGSGEICYYCFHNEEHPKDWKYWENQKDEDRWVMKTDIDTMILNFMALTPIITKKEVQWLTDKIYDRIMEES